MKLCSKFLTLTLLFVVMTVVKYAYAEYLSDGKMTETELLDDYGNKCGSVGKANGYYWVYSSSAYDTTATVSGWDEYWDAGEYWSIHRFPCVYSKLWGGSSATTIYQSIAGVSGVVTVPSELGGKPVSVIGGSSFYGLSKMTEVVLPDTVTKIVIGTPYEGYYDDDDGTWHEPGYAGGAFSGCSGLVSVTVPAVCSFDAMFPNSPNITKVTVTGGRTSICADFAKNRSKINTLMISKQVEQIKGGAFVGCTGLGGGIVIIDDCIFPVSTSYTTSISIGANIKVIADDIWAYCPNLQNISLSTKNEKFKIVGSLLCTADGKKVIGCTDKSVEAIEIPEEVTSIGAYAFYDCRELASVVIPTSVTNIGEKAFYGCSGLTAVSLPSKLKQIEEQAFDGCTGLISMEIPSGVTSVGAGSFKGCENLESLVIPASVIMIGENICDGCEKLKQVTIPACVNRFSRFFPQTVENVIVDEGVENIVGYQFADCTGIRSVTMPQSVKKISDYAFSGCSSLMSVLIPCGVTDIGSEVFRGCGSLTAINIESGNANYASVDGVLYDHEMKTLIRCPQGKTGEFVVPDTVVKIGDEAFAGCSKLTALRIPTSVSQKGWDSFKGCSSLQSLTLPWVDVALRRYFDCFDSLTDISICEGVEEICENWAVDFKNIKTIVLPKTVKCISARAFNGCVELTSVTVPENVTEIKSGAFNGCSKLQDVTFLGNAPVCASDAFGGTAKGVALHAAPSSSGWLMWNGLSVAYDGGDAEPAAVKEVAITVTNVVINYIINSVQPSLVLPATYDTGFVNVITEVKGGCVAIPATWSVNYPDFTTKFGTDFTKALAMQTGKKDGAGNPMFVWQDYVAGTDPTDETDVFTASITIVDGKVKVSYSPELDDARKVLRKYTTWGKKSLMDTAWTEVEGGCEAEYNFFKVTVEMR